MGSIPIGSVTFDEPLSLDYRKSSLEDERVRIPQHQVTDEIHLASCPSCCSKTSVSGIQIFHLHQNSLVRVAVAATTAGTNCVRVTTNGN